MLGVLHDIVMKRLSPGSMLTVEDTIRDQMAYERPLRYTKMIKSLLQIPKNNVAGVWFEVEVAQEV